MGGKKKGGGAKKKKGGDDDEINQDQLYDMLKAKVEALKSRIYLEQERRDNAEAIIDDIRQRESALDKDMDDQKDETDTQVNNMTKIYRQMEDSKNTEITLSRKEVETQEQTKKQLIDEIAKLQKQKEEQIMKKEEEIGVLKDRIDVISSNFAELLKSTLTKMQERIDDANQNYEGDQSQMMDGLGAHAAAAAASM